MAGDWIKMRGNLWDDPRVARLCDLTDHSEAPIIGALYWLWATADQHTENGIMPGLTTRAIDRKTGIEGFGQALCDIGWLADHPEGVRIVNFEEHNGESAKRRSVDAKRKAVSRAAKPGESETVREPSASCPQIVGQDEDEKRRISELEKEKRREEKKNSASITVVGGPRPAVEAPPTFSGEADLQALNGKHIVPLATGWELPESWGIDAEALGWKTGDVLREAEKFRQYWTAGRGAGTRRSVKGWRQTWSNWLEKAARDKR